MPFVSLQVEFRIKEVKQFFIHIGLPRTATTFFQNHLFPHVPEMAYYGLPYTQVNQAFNRMLFEDESRYNSEQFKSEVEALPGNRILLSNENFVGQSLYWHFGNRTRIAQRLSEAMPEARIILFLRNQADLIRSLYLIALQDKETASLADYVRGLPNPYPLSSYQSTPKVDLFDYTHYDSYHAHEQLYGYNYLPLIDLYKNLFSDVRVFLFEDFVADPNSLLDSLGDALDTRISAELKQRLIDTPSVNNGTGNRQSNWLRTLNKWHPLLSSTRVGNALYYRLKRYIIEQMKSPAPVTWQSAQLKTLRETYAAQNRALDQRYPEIGLSRHPQSYFIDS